MEFEFFSATHMGQLRTNNEDAVAQDPLNNLSILADGMGGYNAGEVASNMACELIMADLSPWLHQAAKLAADTDIQRAMSICVNKANRAIFDIALQNPNYNGMGTTLVMAVFRPQRVLIGHIGDSRAYRWRAGHLQQLTKDHSLLQEKIDAGLLTQEEAIYSNNKNFITRALGIEPSVDLDIKTHDLEQGDIVVLCSDGLSDMLNNEAINRVLFSHLVGESLADLTHSLIEAANLAGGRDNIGICMVRALAPTTRGRWLFA